MINIDADPLFADAATCDLRLRCDDLQGECSPCINAGDDSAVPQAITEDFDGNARITGSQVDMGAFEY